jgi:hypothetical protein
MVVSIRFIQWERCCLFAVPAHAVPGALALSGYDPEFGDRSLMPVFDFAQDRLEIHRTTAAIACNRDRRRRHVVGELCSRPGRAGRHRLNVVAV